MSFNSTFSVFDTFQSSFYTQIVFSLSLTRCRFTTSTLEGAVGALLAPLFHCRTWLAFSSSWNLPVVGSFYSTRHAGHQCGLFIRKGSRISHMEASLFVVVVYFLDLKERMTQGGRKVFQLLVHSPVPTIAGKVRPGWW